jgi:MFS family permease
MATLGASATVCAFLVPALSDRFGRRPVIVIFCLIGMICPLAVLYFHGSIYVLGALMFLGWSASGVFPLFMATIPSETVSHRQIATALGLIMGTGEILGGFASPPLAGMIADRTNLSAPVLMQVGCALLAALLALLLAETAPGKVAGAAALTPSEALI